MDALTSVSSITGVSREIKHSTSHINHPCFASLNGSRRKQLENMKYRINLVDSILALRPYTYLPSMLCNEDHVRHWNLEYKAFMKHPRKWNRAIMAQAICEFDLIIKEAGALVASSSDTLIPEPIQVFNTYMDNVREVNEIVECEPSTKGKIGTQVAGKII